MFVDLPPLSDALNAPASLLWGVHSPSSRSMGGKWEEFAKHTVTVFGTDYRLYRHPHLYSNIRVSKFVSEYWYRQNSSTPKRYEELTGWDNSAAKIYKAAYDSATAQKG